MCGIAGILGLDPELARPAAERMLAALRHRGPDDEGLEIVRSGGLTPALLAHTRLSIFDLSPAGHQPMRDGPSDEGISPNVVTYNGEIYNYLALQQELEALGCAMHSRSDTEVLLNAYRAWGVRAVERFEGMFAFCLLDTERGRAWLCRDRLGIKPLYLFRPEGGGLVFASEVRALLASGLVPRRLRRASLESFLAQGAVMSDAAFVEGVELLGPGESLVCDFEGKTLERVRYWSTAFGREPGAIRAPADGSAPGATEPFEGHARYRSEVVEELGLALRRSARDLLAADVPVGLFLSGGVDSTALAILASEVSGQRIMTLSVGFDVPEADESEAAELTARALGTDHRRVDLTGREVLASFEEVLSAVDQPTVDGFNTFFVSRAARQSGLTVALTGLGGDELFGGYRTFHDVPRALYAARLWRSSGAPPRLREWLGERVAGLGRRPGLSERGRALAKLGETLRRPATLPDLYLLRRELFAPELRRRLHQLPDESDPVSGLDVDVVAGLRETVPRDDPRDAVAFLETSSYMRHMLLRDADVFSMAHGLELRVPLLEHRAVEHAARARGAWRRPDPRLKPLLLDAVGTRFPRHVLEGKKRGFTLPWQSWIAGALRDRIAGAVASPRLGDAGLDSSEVARLWAPHQAGDATVSALEMLAFAVLASYLERHRLSL